MRFHCLRLVKPHNIFMNALEYNTIQSHRHSSQNRERRYPENKSSPSIYGGFLLLNIIHSTTITLAYIERNIHSCDIRM
jgi:hypothetical protein